MGRVTDRRRVMRVRDAAVSRRVGHARRRGAAGDPAERQAAHHHHAHARATTSTLAAGFLVSEGVLGSRGRPRGRSSTAPGRPRTASNTYNVVDVPPRARRAGARHHRWNATSTPPPRAGCAGRRAWTRCARRPGGRSPTIPLRLDPRLLAALPDRLRAAQRVFDRTGGLHAAGLFDAAGDRCACARTWAGTTRSTSCSAGPCRRGGCRSGPPCSWSRGGPPSSSRRRP